MRSSRKAAAVEAILPDDLTGAIAPTPHRQIGRTVVLRLRFDDFSRATRSHTLRRATANTQAVRDTARELLGLAVPLIELSQYAVVTTQVPVSSSPTLVLIDRTQHASTIVGFADRFEIAQRVDDALAAK